MKKRALLIIFIFTFMVTGCGSSKKVTCTMTKEFEVGYKLEAKVSGDITDGNIENSKLVMTMTFDDIQIAKSSYENLQKEYADGDENVDIHINGKTITVTEVIEQDGVVSKKDFIDAYQEEGYTCE